MSEGDRHKPLAGALGRIPSGLFVVTVRRGESETGMLASWVQQCSFDPPQITLALRRDREVNAWLAPGVAFTVNILEAGQTDMIAHFGRGFAAGEPAFTDVEVERPGGIAPVLAEALAYLECLLAERHPAGDHDLCVARVVGGRVLGEGQPMVHVRKSGFHY
jgi:flavin reductase (DIM6/NTAB) family NADH-FMN oxidoreductase RutF